MQWVIGKVRSRTKSGRAVRRAAKWTVESLERRLLLSSVAWTGNGDGVNWTDAKNWSSYPNLPGASDDVTINAPGNPSIQIPSNDSEVVRSVSSTDPLVISGGTLSIAATSQLAYLILINNAQVAASSILTVTGTLSVASGGQIYGSGKLIIAAGATANVSSTLGLGLEVDNSGTFNLIGAQLGGYEGAGEFLFDNLVDTPALLTRPATHTSQGFPLGNGIWTGTSDKCLAHSTLTAALRRSI